MNTSPTLDALIPNIRQQLLATLFAKPERAWYAAELAKHIGVRRSGVQYDLRALTRAGILKTYRKGRMIFFRPDDTSPTYEELRRLIEKTVGILGTLRDVLEPFRGDVAVAFIYGSVAAGHYDSASDIDLMVVGTVQLRDLAPKVAEASAQLLRPVNPTVYSVAEFRHRASGSDEGSFLQSVLAKPKLFVLGSKHELEGVIGGKESRKASRGPKRNR